MAHNKLTPEQHFCTVYKSKIVDLGETVNMYDPVSVSYGPNPYHQHVEMRTEKVISIKMPESEFNRFIKSYQDYLDLIYGIQNPIVHDMFEKMMMYIKLMK
jgi:hypothetical protein